MNPEDEDSVFLGDPVGVVGGEIRKCSGEETAMEYGLFFLKGDEDNYPGIEDTCLLLGTVSIIPGSEACTRSERWT